MSTESPSRAVTDRSGRSSAAGDGLTIFAAATMMITGVWQVLAGIAALLADEVYIATPGYVYSFDLTAWGWIHLVLGVLVAVAGFAVTRGSLWARIAGIALACLSLITNFLFIPHHPVWSMVIIALDVAVVWALATQRRDPV